MEEAYIISHPECDDGFPDECPLLKENGILPNHQCMAHRTPGKQRTSSIQAPAGLDARRASNRYEAVI